MLRLPTFPPSRLRPSAFLRKNDFSPEGKKFEREIRWEVGGKLVGSFRRAQIEVFVLPTLVESGGKLVGSRET